MFSGFPILSGQPSGESQDQLSFFRDADVEIHTKASRGAGSRRSLARSGRPAEPSHIYISRRSLAWGWRPAEPGSSENDVGVHGQDGSHVITISNMWYTGEHAGGLNYVGHALATKNPRSGHWAGRFHNPVASKDDEILSVLGRSLELMRRPDFGDKAPAPSKPVSAGLLRYPFCVDGLAEMCDYFVWVALCCLLLLLIESVVALCFCYACLCMLLTKN